MRVYQRVPIEDRFWQHVMPEPNSGCWLWDGYIDSRGYGRIGLGGRGGGMTGAHRISLKIAGVEVPNDKLVLHKCDVPACVNPEHLFVGTQADNINDMHRKGRRIYSASPFRGRQRTGWTHPNSKKTHCKRGHPLSGGNLSISRGVRCCRACWRIKAATKRATQKEETS